MEIENLQGEIDNLDEQILEMFKKRIDMESELGQLKATEGLSLSNSEVTRKKIYDLVSKSPEKYRNYIYTLFANLFDVGDSIKIREAENDNSLAYEVKNAIKNTPNLFPEMAIVATQGVEGAYQQQACDKLFINPSIMYFNSFEAVFAAVDNGLCEYGVLPLENSTAGSVNKIYDLMMKYNFYITRSTRIKIDHNLLVKPGTKLSDIKEIISHEQALNQSTKFLGSLKGVKSRAVANTAMAAKMVAEQEGNSIAALSSSSCAELYGLECLEESVQDQGNNYTRFICISKNMQIFPGSDKTSIMMTLKHKPGSLYKVLARFYSLNINLIKLESRPLPNKDFEFMFYFDIEASIYSDKFAELLAELKSMCETFKYLGSYIEVV